MRASSSKMIVQNVIFVIMSLVIAFFSRIPIVPGLPFLKLDFSDTPILIATLILGTPSGVAILISVSILRAVFFSSAGIAGCVVRLTSLVLIFTMGYLRNKVLNLKDKPKDLNQEQNRFPFSAEIFSLVKVKIILMTTVGVLVCTLIKIPINYFFWLYFFGMKQNFVTQIVFPIILPFNILKATLNCVAALCLTPWTNNLMTKLSKCG